LACSILRIAIDHNSSPRWFSFIGHQAR
jgi:hypothetical protein